MTSQSHGVQQLLAAEKKASEKVTEARKRKARRLKQAKDEAQLEIDKFRTEKEKQFKEYEASHMDSKEDVTARIDAEAKLKLAEVDKLVAQRKKATVEKLLNIVYDVDPKVHRNFVIAKPENPGKP
ncbi:V-type proton ATPase subunit G-like [Ornithodoros turicata]|uniref:V-type proton ATPase subunit G-like n=1 Tax=Ornithodoros turicata TaxID=34597 RepID=UPI00313894EA